MKKFLLSMFFVLTATLGIQAQKVSLDFTSNTWGLPEASANKAVDAATFTSGDYSVILTGSTGNGYYFNTDGYLMLGKNGASLALPAFDFAVSKIEVVGRTGASTGTLENIYVGETAVSTQCKGSATTNSFQIAESHQAAGNVYVLKIESKHNAQITTINIYEASSEPTEPEGGETPEEPETPSNDYLNETFATDLGSFTTQETVGNYPWVFAQNYGAKASGYANGASQDAESWLISPAMNLTGETKASIAFDYVINKGDANAAATNHKLLITNNYTGDVTTTEWTEVEYGAVNNGNWTFSNTGNIALPESMMDKPAVVIAFKYVSTTENSSTWEIKNVVVSGEKGATVEPEEPEGGEGEGEVTYLTIAEVIAAGAGEAATKGTVVATYARGFLMNDGTGSILVYQGSDKGIIAGDAVTVSGTTSVYGGLLQFGNTAVVEKTGTATVTHPAVTVMDGAALDAFIAAPAIQYVEYTGTLTINNNYYNVAVDGATTATGSIQYPQDAIKANLTSGAVVKVTGYTIGVSSSKYVNTMAVKVETVGEGGGEPEEPEVPTETQEYTVTEALAAYVDGKQIPAIVTGYIVGAVKSAPEKDSQFGPDAAVATNILISDNAETLDYTECLIVQLPSGDIRSALNLVDNPGNYKKQVKVTGSVEKYFKVAGLKGVTAYEFTGVTGIEDVKGENGNVKTIYDLQGRKVENPTKGIYIINGKKVLVK
ncbi:MAG: choice-of-anchor J domain-containing protein [Bacteroidaceae bacterium]|nr:choice-of-anchor J domain-containing protein [Bacteroidaceae bacterium]